MLTELPGNPLPRHSHALASDRNILEQLVARATSSSGASLLQFRCRSAAHQYLPLYDLFRRHVPCGARVLDWGSGNGHASYFLSHAGYRVTRYVLGDSLDETAWFDEAAWPGTQPPVLVGRAGDPTEIPVNDGSFDAVTSVGVLEHVEETGGNFLASLRELNRIVRPGGLLVVCHLPSSTSWIEWAARHAPGGRGHVHPFSRRELEQLLGESNWQMTELGRYGFLPGNFWKRAPKLGDRLSIATTWDRADQMLGRVFPAITQNFRFVATRPETE